MGDDNVFIEDDPIEVKKYNIQYYIDVIHCYGLVTCDDYFVGAPYNFIIRVKKTNDPDDEHQLVTFSSEKPANCYNLDFNSGLIQSEVHSVKVAKKWINDCYELHKLSQKLKDTKKDLFRNAPTVKTPHDIYTECFANGLDFIENDREYDLALIEFHKCLDIKKSDPLAMYNIACCYSHKCDTENTLKWLNQSADNGMHDYNHTENDRDLDFVKKNDSEGFSKVIEKQKQLLREMC